MAIAKSEFSDFIKKFQFRELFNDMGWNNVRTKQPIVVDNRIFNLSGVAEKSGFLIFTCSPDDSGNLPDRAARKKIEGNVFKLFPEHLIIFIDDQKKEQIWQLAVRKEGSPVKRPETAYHILKDPELLYQRTSGFFFTLDEEEKVTIIDVTKRVAENFQQNTEKVTKKFYENFKKEHTIFLKFIKGIEDQMSLEWYVSLMLNRLMFCYFIQRKGFLDNNKNYLQDKLKACRGKKGKNQFYSFYRDFLLILFHKGLGTSEHSDELEVEIGRIPYLNGGLFDVHELEKTYANIEIEDQAFENIFNLFDQYEWHLDTRETASGRDVNPDVIGYIFEKYINDRAQMGAYYTKEDITDYISKNCIIPWLFDEVKRNYPKAFAPDGWLRTMMKNSGDNYIYKAVKYGVPESGGLFDDLPPEIQKGFNPELEKKTVDGNGPWLWEFRKDWNKTAPSNIALPTEIYREVIERRKRCADIKSKIANGEVREINDFITYNLDIRQFAQDVVETADDAEFIRQFYKALSSITILDPTCGSGAFLFAAMNILEELYDACIRRMTNFIDESSPGKHKFFEEVLAQVNSPEHPNLKYFIFKSIILNNLYGVDIMNEAVEIAKLRLFLKLAAAVDADYRKPNLGLEPLPDVDFNIRAGNALVGYATKKQVEDIRGMFVTEEHKKKIMEQCEAAALAFTRYKEIQLTSSDDYEEFKKAKDELNERLKSLTDDLDGILYMEQYKGYSFEGQDYKKWLETHQPFHWFAEFYEIIHNNGGFDVLIGNPPYVEYSRVQNKYHIKNYYTEKAGNLYAFIIENSFNIINSNSYIGMIIPLTSVSSNNMKLLRNVIFSNCNIYISSYEIRPSKLFEGVDQRLTIFLRKKCSCTKVYSTNIRRWYSEQRDILFDNFSYEPTILENRLLRFTDKLELDIWNKYRSHREINNMLTLQFNNNTISYRTAGARYWIIFLNNQFKTESLSNKTACFQMNYNSKVISAGLNSSLFWWWYATNFDMFNIKDYMIFSFRYNYKDDKGLLDLSIKLETDLEKNKIHSITNSKTRGKVTTFIYQKKLSKSIIDEIDTILARHYGFTHGELDFIINYDIKYRMGKEQDNEEASDE